MDLNSLLALLRGYAPEELALPGDPVGVLIEPRSRTVRRLVVCLDATRHVAQTALETGADMIVAHHPLIYNPLKRLERSDPIASVAMELVEGGIGLFAMHTNWDAAGGGINDTLAARLRLQAVRQPSGGSAESRLLRVGTLGNPASAADFLSMVERELSCTGASALRFALPQRITNLAVIHTVAVCGGAGASMAADALTEGADAFVTADARHHEFIDAAARGLLLIDAGHEATESPGMSVLAERISRDAPELRVTFCPNGPR